MEEWKDENSIDRLKEGLQNIVNKTGDAIRAADPEGHLDYLSEGLQEHLLPYSQKAVYEALEEDPEMTAEELLSKIDVMIKPIIKQFTLDKMNVLLERDGYYDPVNKILQTRFPPDSDIEKAEFAYVTDDKGVEHFGLKYEFKNGTSMFFGEDTLEAVNQVIISKGGMDGYDEMFSSPEFPI